MPKVLIGNTDSSNEPERPKKTFISNIHGDDAYELAVENGFEGDMQAWLASLEGEVGFTPFFVVTDTHIQVGYQRGTEVIAPVNLVSLDDLRPEAGSARWDTILNKPDKFPPADHKHQASDIEGLVGDISKAEAEEMDEEILRLAKEHADALTVDWDSLSGKPLSFIPAAHTHTISGVDGLDIALSNKSDVGHGHSASEISGLPDPGTSKTYVDEELAKKSNISHTHQASDISGLPAAPDVTKAYVDSELTKKSNTTHTHDFGTLTNRPTSYPPLAHQHPASDITGLPTPDVNKAYVDTELGKKANTSHTHPASDISGLSKSSVGLNNVDNTSDSQKPVSSAQKTELDKKSNTGHKHPISDITDMPVLPRSLDVQEFVPTGVPGSSTLYPWTKPEGAKVVHFWGYGAGGGGGSGSVRATTAAGSGGGGGGAGSFFDVFMPANLVPPTMEVRVGKGGAGGAAQSTPDGNGSGGGPGAPSNVNSAALGTRITANGGNGGGGGTSASASGGLGQWGFSQGSLNAPSGGGGALAAAGSNGGTASNTWGFTATAGGGGGGLGANSTTAYMGGRGGENNNTNVNPGGAAGAAGGGNGGAGVPTMAAGIGGGGGGSSADSNGGSGGHASAYAAGGGGGGAARNGFSSGAGGNGADGIVIITTYF